jgi:branched-chain amino acid transport system ATP-binding protein
VHGTRLTGLAPHRIARLGVARTFQNIALLPGETVEENLLLGRHRLIRAWRRGSGRHRDRVREIAAFVGLTRWLDTPAGTLSYGDQKRVELGRALCGEPDLLLLDEPAAGMNATETAAVAGLIRAIRNSLGIAILLVEHDMGLVMGIADRITALDFGVLIADGTPAEVRADHAVQTAYLGLETPW